MTSNYKFQIPNSKEKGFVFLEVLIAIALINVVFIVLLSIGVLSLSLSTVIQKTAKADSLIREELEAVRSLRDGTIWATDGLGIASTGSANPYHLTLDTVVNPPKWKLEAGTETVSNFTRRMVFDKVSRDPSTQNIEAVYNASHDDANTRKITVTVSDSDNTYQVITYLTNWQD